MANIHGLGSPFANLPSAQKARRCDRSREDAELHQRMMRRDMGRHSVWISCATIHPMALMFLAIRDKAMELLTPRHHPDQQVPVVLPTGVISLYFLAVFIRRLCIRLPTDFLYQGPAETEHHMQENRAGYKRKNTKPIRRCKPSVGFIAPHVVECCYNHAFNKRAYAANGLIPTSP